MSESSLFDISTKGSDLYHRLKVSSLKRLFTQYCTPDALNFCGGLPQTAVFPLHSIQCTIHVPTTLDQTEDISLPPETVDFSLNKNSDLYLQYMRGDGIIKLKGWIQEHMEHLHKPAAAYSTCISVGATDSVAKIFQLLNGDSVMFDKLAYNTTVAACCAIGKIPIGVEIDNYGMVPESLRQQTLLAREQGLCPTAVYLVPVAQNPTGITMNVTRKQAIYAVCREVDLVIIEDDAYYYLYYGDEDTTCDYNLTTVPGITNLPPSLLSMDTDGRVIRIDTIAKFIAPGFRLGWISGPQAFVLKYQLYQEMSSQFPSGISMSIFLGMMKQWGTTGLDSHIRQIQVHYKRQRDVMYNTFLTELGEHFPLKVNILRPSGGMFIWLKVEDEAIKTSDDLFLYLADMKVITVPGKDFFIPSLIPIITMGCETPSFDLQETCGAAVRLSYAAANEDQIKDGVRKIANKIKALFTGVSFI